MQNNKKVWVVDDDKSIRWVLEKALKSNDVDIESFSRPEQVLEKIKNEENGSVAVPMSKLFEIVSVIFSLSFFSCRVLVPDLTRNHIAQKIKAIF